MTTMSQSTNVFCVSFKLNKKQRQGNHIDSKIILDSSQSFLSDEFELKSF